MFAETPVVVFKWVAQRQDINIMFEEQLKALLDKVQLPAHSLLKYLKYFTIIN